MLLMRSIMRNTMLLKVPGTALQDARKCCRSPLISKLSFWMISLIYTRRHIYYSQTMEKGKQIMETNSQPLYVNKYPEPLKDYTEVVADRNLFVDTLIRLYGAMEIEITVPVVAGRNLDLHRLFIEVTSRGGMNKVTNDGKWNEIADSFGLHANTAFDVRDIYMSSLLDYEKVYYFGSQGSNSAPSAPLTAPSSALVPFENPIEHALPHQGQSPASNICVTGVIDGKFEYGYSVTAMVGTEVWKGVMYPVSQNTVYQETGSHKFKPQMKKL